jgi:hypothetical protein
MRHTLANHQEVAHFWGNEVQEDGASGNMFFKNRTIFSYGSHFAIAKHYDNNLILFTNRGYSNSTSAHISYTKRAIPCDKNILYCHNPERPADIQNHETAIRGIEDNLKKAVRARERKQEYLSNAEYAYNQIIQLIKIFKIKGWKIPKYDFTTPETITEYIKERERKAEAKRKRQLAKQKKQDALDRVLFLEDVVKWKSGEIKSAYDVQHRRFANEVDYCRIDGDIVESMRSANAPLKAVKVVLRRILQGKPVKGVELGHYTIISYDGESLKIGCHDFPQSEIDWLIRQLGI